MRRLLSIALFIALLPSGANVPHKGSLQAGTDMFWQVWENEIGTETVPSEVESIEQLRLKGYRIEN